MLVDTHCHLTDAAFDADRVEVMERMRAAGVGRALVIESSPGRLPATLALVGENPTLGVSTGCHPHDAASWTAGMRATFESAWKHAPVLGVGEIGLDYHYNHAPRDVQRSVFAEQLALAVQYGLPAVIHAREADADVVAILSDQPRATVVLHSFSSSSILRDAGLDSGWYFSFSGMVTFRNWTQPDTVRAVASDRILVETDAPYLAPVPFRGKRNEPAFVVEVARTVANMRGVGYEEFAAQATANAIRVFWSRGTV